MINLNPDRVLKRYLSNLSLLSIISSYLTMLSRKFPVGKASHYFNTKSYYYAAKSGLISLNYLLIIQFFGMLRFISVYPFSQHERAFTGSHEYKYCVRVPLRQKSELIHVNCHHSTRMSSLFVANKIIIEEKEN